MDTAKGDWMNENLHRQRLQLEEKQRQKRLTSGVIRSSPFDSSRTTSSSSFPSTMSSPPLLIDFSSPLHPTTIISSPPPSSESINPLEESRQSITPSLHNLTLSPSHSEDDIENGEDVECARVAVSPRIDEKDGLIVEMMVPIKEPDYARIQANPAQFVNEPAEEGVTYKCTITRDKNGMDRGIFPTYFLHLENNTNTKLLLLSARKRKKCKTANYLLSTDPTQLSRASQFFVGKVRSNALGTSFTIYDNGSNPKHHSSSERVRAELAAVVYDPNVLGFRGPRKMTIVTPGLTVNKEIIKIQPVSEKDTLLERLKSSGMNELVKMTNKAPIWSEESQSFVLNFHGRVTQASVKNFQIVHVNDEEYVVMQFGRVSQDTFSMDFRYPLSATQAFGIAMTSFHGKIACE